MPLSLRAPVCSVSEDCRVSWRSPVFRLDRTAFFISPELPVNALGMYDIGGRIAKTVPRAFAPVAIQVGDSFHFDKSKIFDHSPRKPSVWGCATCNEDVGLVCSLQLIHLGETERRSTHPRFAVLRFNRNRSCKQAAVSGHQKGKNMKKYLMVTGAACAALVLVGCTRDDHRRRGGMSETSGSQVGTSTQPTGVERSDSLRSTNTNNNAPASGTTSSDANSQGSASDRSSGAGSDDNRTPASK